MAPHFSTLAWETPWTEERGKLQSMGLLRVRHDWGTSLSLSLSRAMSFFQRLCPAPFLFQFCLLSSWWSKFSCFFACLIIFFSNAKIVCKWKVEIELKNIFSGVGGCLLCKATCVAVWVTLVCNWAEFFCLLYCFCVSFHLGLQVVWAGSDLPLEQNLGSESQ